MLLKILSCSIARRNMALPACSTQSSMVELPISSKSHAQCPISRHTAGPCCHQASRSLTNPIQMLGLLREPEVSREHGPESQHFKTSRLFFSATEEPGIPLLRELQHAASKQQEVVLNSVFLCLEFLFKLSQVLSGFS